MLVFWQQRLVILAVPKTGTSALASALAPMASIVVSNPPELKHAPLYRYNNFFRPMFERLGGPEMETIAVVREPLDWLGSWYRYRRRSYLDGQPQSTRDVSFDEFVRAYCDANRPAFADVGSQARFLEPRPNGVRVNRVFAYETPEALLGYLSARLGQVVQPDRENESPSADLTISDEAHALLTDQYAADFDLWHAALRAVPPGITPTDEAETSRST